MGFEVALLWMIFKCRQSCDTAVLETPLTDVVLSVGCYWSVANVGLGLTLL